MDKPKTKDELLKEQAESSKGIPTSTGESPDVKRARDDAEIANQNLKKREAEIKQKLQEEGFKSVEEASQNIKKQMAEATAILEHAKQEEQRITQENETLQQEKQKMVNAYKKVKDTEALVNTRLEEAIKLEQSRQSNLDNHSAVIGQLKELAEYHREHITPCRKALYNVSLGIYNFADALNSARIDFSELYNYIGKVMKQIDKYVNTENKKLPADILEELTNLENKGGREQ